MYSRPPENEWNDIDWLEHELEQIMRYVEEPELFRQREHHIRQTLLRAVHTPPVYHLAVVTLSVCLPRVRWHERYPEWIKIVSGAAGEVVPGFWRSAAAEGRTQNGASDDKGRH